MVLSIKDFLAKDVQKKITKSNSVDFIIILIWIMENSFVSYR